VFDGLAPARITPAHPELLAELRADPTKTGSIERTFITRSTDGWHVPIEVIELRWTGPLERWFVIARQIGEPEEPGGKLDGKVQGRSSAHGTLSKREREDRYNVDQHTVLRLTSQPASFVINNPQFTPQPENLYIRGADGELHLDVRAPIDRERQRHIIFNPTPTLTFQPSTQTVILDNGRAKMQFTLVDFLNENLAPYRPPAERGEEQ
jgi:hypothetical protein